MTRLRSDQPVARDSATETRWESRAARAPVVTRVNARLDEATARELEQLVAETGASVTDVIKNAIHCYHLSLAGKGKRSSFDLFGEAGLIGCAEGPANLSTRYKEALTGSLLEKHGVE